MKHFNLETLRELAEYEGEHLLSLLAPMQRAGREVRQNEIRWKNMLKDACHKLAGVGLDEEQINAILKPAKEKLSDDNYWQQQSDGLAEFLTEDRYYEFQLPISLEQNVVVADRFHLRPLLSVANNDAHCLVLAASPNRVRLLKITGDAIKDVQPKEMPSNLRDALNIDEYVSALQHHSVSSNSSNGKRTAAFHGHGGSDSEIKKQDEILQYFYRLNDVLSQHLETEDVPLIFAGVDYLFPIFRQACKYPSLHDENISGNPDDWSAAEIYERTRPILARFEEKKKSGIISRYGEKSYTDWASCDPKEIYSAAKMGQVETLILSERFSKTAKLNSDKSLRITKIVDSESVDLGNLILVEVLRSGGAAVEVGRSELPGNTKLAAVFRSPVSKYREQESN